MARALRAAASLPCCGLQTSKTWIRSARREAAAAKRDVAEAVAGARAGEATSGSASARRNNLWLHGRRRRRRKPSTPIVPAVAEGPPRRRHFVRRPRRGAAAAPAIVARPRLKDAPGRSSQSSRLKEAPLPLSPQTSRSALHAQAPPPPPETVKRTRNVAAGGGTRWRVLERVARDTTRKLWTPSPRMRQGAKKRLRDCCRKLRKTRWDIGFGCRLRRRQVAPLPGLPR